MITRIQDRETYLPLSLLRLIIMYLAPEDGERAVTDYRGESAEICYLLVMENLNAYARGILGSLERMGQLGDFKQDWRQQPWAVWKGRYDCGNEPKIRGQLGQFFKGLAADWKTWPERATGEDFGFLAHYYRGKHGGIYSLVLSAHHNKNFDMGIFLARHASEVLLDKKSGAGGNLLRIAIEQNHQALLAALGPLEEKILLNNNDRLWGQSYIEAAIEANNPERVERYLKKYSQFDFTARILGKALAHDRPEIFALGARCGSLGELKEVGGSPLVAVEIFLGEILLRPDSHLYLQPLLERYPALFLRSVTIKAGVLAVSPREIGSLIEAAFVLGKGAEILQLWNMKPEPLPEDLPVKLLMNVFSGNRLRSEYISDDFKILLAHIKSHEKIYFQRNPGIFVALMNFVFLSKSILHLKYFFAMQFSCIEYDRQFLRAIYMDNIELAHGFMRLMQRLKTSSLLVKFGAQIFDQLEKYIQATPVDAPLAFVKDRKSNVRLVRRDEIQEDYGHQEIKLNGADQARLARFRCGPQARKLFLLLDIFLEIGFCQPSPNDHERSVLESRVLRNPALILLLASHHRGQHWMTHVFGNHLPEILLVRMPKKIVSHPSIASLRQREITRLIESDTIIKENFALRLWHQSDLFTTILQHPRGMDWLHNSVRISTVHLFTPVYEDLVKHYPRLNDLRKSLGKIFKVFNARDSLSNQLYLHENLHPLLQCAAADEKQSEAKSSTHLTFDIDGMPAAEVASKQTLVRNLFACTEIAKSHAMTALAKQYPYIQKIQQEQSEAKPAQTMMLMDTRNPLLNCLIFLEMFHQSPHLAKDWLKTKNFCLAPFLGHLSLLHWAFAVGKDDDIFSVLTLDQIRTFLATDPQGKLIAQVIHSGRDGSLIELLSCGSRNIVLDNQVPVPAKCKEVITRFKILEELYQKQESETRDYLAKLDAKMAPAEKIAALLKGEPKKSSGFWGTVYKLTESQAEFIQEQLGPALSLEDLDGLMHDEMIDYYENATSDPKPVYYARVAVIQREILPALRAAELQLGKQNR